MRDLLRNSQRRYQAMKTQLPYLPRALHLVWQAAPRWTILWGIFLLIQSVLPVLLVFLTREVVNQTTEAVEAGLDIESMRPVLPVIVALIVLFVLTDFIKALTGWARATQADLASDHISSLIQSQAAALDLGFFETPDYYDKLHRARIDAANRPIQLLNSLGTLIQRALTLIGMLAILISYTVWLPLVLFASAIPILWVLVGHTQRTNRWRLGNTVNERRSYYYSTVMTDRAVAAELRLFDLNDHYLKEFKTLRKQIRQERLVLRSKKMVADLIGSALSLAAASIVLFWMAWRVVEGRSTLGDLAAFYQIFSQGQAALKSLLRQANGIYESILFLENLFDFLSLEPQIKQTAETSIPPMPLQDGIHFDNITFWYPGSQRPALKNFSLTVPAGKVVALVGENGEGKSTLMKLLCRFYDPQEGRVLWDGVDLRDLSPPEIRQQITMLFQMPYQYHETARKNIAIGDLASNPTNQQVEDAARQSGATAPISRLPQGLETVLGKMFGGEELSLGEWQRVALARAFIRQRPIMILDEPTSAMDSWAELDWLNHFREMANGRTAIMITHRFTTAMKADHIYVMQNGTIVESGTHDSLLAENGRYAQSWYAQIEDDGVPTDQ